MSDGSTIEYRIKTTADVRGLQDVKKGLEDQIKASKEAGRSAALFERELNKVNEALNTQKGRLGSQAVELEKTIAAMSKAGINASGLAGERNAILKTAGMSKPSALTSAATAFMDSGGGIGGMRAAAGTFGAGAAATAAGAATAFAVGAKSLNEYADAEERVAKLDAALAQRGQLTEAYREQLQSLAGDLQNLTAIADDEWVDVMTKLTQMGASSGSINGAVDAVKNLAGLMGGDLNSAAMLVGKALQGEFAAFSRLGITFDEHASQVEKLDRLYRELALRGGGQLEAAAQTINGQFRSLKNSASDFFEAIGRGVAKNGTVQAVIYGLSTSLSWLAQAMGGPVDKAGALQNAMRTSGGAMVDAEAKAQAYAKALEEVKTNAAEAATALNSALAAMKAQQDLDIEKESAQADLKAAQIDAAVKGGTMTKEQGVMAKAAIRADLADVREAKAPQLRAAEKSGIDRVVRGNLAIGEEAQTKAAQEQAKIGKFENLQAQADALMAKWDKKLRAKDHDIEQSKDLRGEYSINVMRSERAAMEAQRDGELAKFKRTNGFFDVDAQKETAATEKKKADEIAQSVFKANNPLIERRQQIDMVDRVAPEIHQTRQRTARIQAVEEALTEDGAPQGPVVNNRNFQRGIQRMAPGGQPLQALERNLTAGEQYWASLASGLSRIENISTRQEGAFQNALRRMQDTERKLEMLESRMRNAPGR